jgi:hypothetical protein
MQDSLPEEVDPGERITRYLTNPKWFNATTKNISPQAFKPASPKPPVRLVRRTSVYRTLDCIDLEVWMIGDEYVTKRHAHQLPVLGRADIQNQIILTEGLSIVPQPDPHPRHANIENWPESDEQWQAKSLALARNAQLLIKPKPD